MVVIVVIAVVIVIIVVAAAAVVVIVVIVAPVVVIIVIIIDSPPSNVKLTQLEVMELLEKRHAHVERAVMTLSCLWTCIADNSSACLETIGNHDLLAAP